MSFGSLGAAMETIENPQRAELFGRARAVMRALADGAEYPLLVQLTGLDRDRAATRALLLLLIAISREAMAAKLTGGAAQSFAAQIAARLPLPAWLGTLEVLTRAVEYLDHNAGRGLLSVWLCAGLLSARTGAQRTGISRPA